MLPPRPYYEDDAVTIYNADCRDVLPTLGAVDLVLTDPPYGIGRDGKLTSTSSHGGHKGYEFLGWDAIRPHLETFNAIFAASRNQIIWGGQYFADLLPAQRGWLIWDKGQRIDQADAELAWTSLDKPVRVYTLNRVALMQDGAVHPTQKPLSLIRWCIQESLPAQTILDPFMGSGTTLRAAKDLGRKAIGIEIEERYCEIAAKRMSQSVMAL